MLIVAAPSPGQMVVTLPPTVSGHLNLHGEIDDSFNILPVDCPRIITGAVFSYHCDLTGSCDCLSCGPLPNGFCRMVEPTNESIYGQVTGVHDLNYTLDIWNDLIRFSGSHTQVSNALISGHAGSGCSSSTPMTCSADSDALIEVDQVFTMTQSDFVQVIGSLMLSTMIEGTRELDWWIIDLTTNPNADEFTPGAVIAEHHLRMCDPVADDNISDSIFVQLPAGPYRFKARYASQTGLSISSINCDPGVPPLTDMVGPGLDSWSLTLTFGVCTADVTPPGGNGVVNIDDLVFILNSFGPCTPGIPCPADVTPPGGNGVVNIDDYVFILNNFGECLDTPPGGFFYVQLLDNEDWYGAEAIDLSTPSVDNSISNTTKGVPAPRLNCFGLDGCQLGYAAGVVGGKWYVVTGNGQQLTASLCGSPEVNPTGLTITLDALRIFTDDNPPGMNPIPINHNGSFWDCAAAYLGNVCFPLPADPCEADTTFSWNSVAGQHYWIFVHGVFPLDGDFCTPSWPQTSVAGPFDLTVTSP